MMGLIDEVRVDFIAIHVLLFSKSSSTHAHQNYLKQIIDVNLNSDVCSIVLQYGKFAFKSRRIPNRRLSTVQYVGLDNFCLIVRS